MANDLPSRMLRLLSLLQTRREWSGAELAQRLGVTTRTVRRDVDRLRELEYPVEGTTGRAGGYRLAAGAAMPPLVLDDAEATATAVALRTAAGRLIGIEETCLRALAKLEQVLPARLRAQVAAVQEATTAVEWEHRGPRADPAVLSVLAAACRDREIVTFSYTTRAGRGGERRVDPYHLVASGGLWYLLAHDHLRDDWRVYRLDRITGLAPTRHRYAPRPVPGGDPAVYAAGKIASAPVRHRAVATLEESAEAVRHRTRALASRIRPAGPGRCTVDCSSDHLPVVAQILASLDADYTLDADAAVHDHLRAMAHRALSALNSGE